MFDKERLSELLDVTDRDKVGEPVITTKQDKEVAYECPQCGKITKGTNDKVETICPTCKVPLVTKREESKMDKLENIGTTVEKLKTLLGDLGESKQPDKKEQDEEPDEKDDKEDDKEDDEEDKDKKEGKSGKKEQDDDVMATDNDDDDEEDDDEEEEDEAKKPKNESVDEQANDKVDTKALLNFLNTKTGADHKIASTTFDEKGNLVIKVEPDIHGGVTAGDIAKIFDIEAGSIEMGKDFIKLKGMNMGGKTENKETANVKDMFKALKSLM